MRQLLFLLLALCPLGLAQAQESSYTQESAAGRKERIAIQDYQILRESTHLFEGQLLSTFSYFNADTSRIYHTSVIDVTKTLKGPAMTGTVRVFYGGAPIFLGSTPGTYGVDAEANLDVDILNLNRLRRPIWPLPQNTKFVLFCRRLPTSYAARPPATDLSQADHSSLFEVLGGSQLVTRDSIQSPAGARFATQQAYYQYLADKSARIAANDAVDRKPAKRPTATPKAPSKKRQ